MTYMDTDAFFLQNKQGKRGLPGTWKLRVWVRDLPHLKPRRISLGLGRARTRLEALLAAEVLVRAFLITGVGCDRVSFHARQVLPRDWEALLAAIRQAIWRARRSRGRKLEPNNPVARHAPPGDNSGHA